MRKRFAATVALLVAYPLAAAYGEAAQPRGCLSCDSLAFPTEILVITKEELVDYNVHTLEDVLELVSDVSFWREGPHGSRTGFSVDGRSHVGVTLLVNGEPFYDPYTFEPLSRFLQISRLERIEVIYSGSPYFVGDCSANGAINIVIEEGGRAGPVTALDFTFGRGNKRARRAWFSTPEAHLNATLAYDQYLQDAVEAIADDPNEPKTKIGDYDSRSVLMDVLFSVDSGDEILVRLQRYEDTYHRTTFHPKENIRYDGFASFVRYRRGGLRVSLNQRDVEMSRIPSFHAGLLIGGSASWEGPVRDWYMRLFATGERSVFENRVPGTSFDPDFHRLEGGLTAGGEAPFGLAWRGGVFGGDHSIIGSYVSGEIGLMKPRGGPVAPSLVIARRVRVPTAQELFQPPTDLSWLGIGAVVAGSTDLGPEVTDEVSLGGRFYNTLWVDLFARKEKSRMILTGSDSLVYRSEGEGEVTGGKARFVYNGDLLGFDYGLKLGLEVFGKRSDWTPGIPRYRFTGGLRISRSVFRESEVVTLRWDSEASGNREWGDVELDAYAVHNIALSMTLMGAVIRFQVKNLFGTKYETFPGFLMPEQHYLIGVFWELFD